VHPFVFDIARLRVVFGRGTRSRVVQEVESLGAKQVVIIVSPSHARSAAAVADQLGRRCAVGGVGPIALGLMIIPTLRESRVTKAASEPSIA